MLNIADNGIGNKGLAILSKVKFINLHYLNLENNNLTSKCISSLNQLITNEGTIMDLRLGKNNLEDNCIIELSYSLFKASCKLKRLDLDQNPISEVGLNSIFESLVNNQCLEHLNLEECTKVGISDKKRIQFLSLMLLTN